MDRFVEDDDNAESFLSQVDSVPRDPVGRGMDVNKGFTFTEVNSIRASASKLVCCHFSSDGKLLATGGHDKKVGCLHPRLFGKKGSKGFCINFSSRRESIL